MKRLPPARVVRRRVVLYNPPSLFWTMPLALVAIGSALDPDRFDAAALRDLGLPAAEKTLAESEALVRLALRTDDRVSELTDQAKGVAFGPEPLPEPKSERGMGFEFETTRP